VILAGWGTARTIHVEARLIMLRKPRTNTDMLSSFMGGAAIGTLRFVLWASFGVLDVLPTWIAATLLAAVLVNVLADNLVGTSHMVKVSVTDNRVVLWGWNLLQWVASSHAKSCDSQQLGE